MTSQIMSLSICFAYIYGHYGNAAYAAQLLIGTISYDKEGSSWHKEWHLDLDYHLPKGKCSVLITGSLVVPLESEVYWFSGNGKLTFSGHSGAAMFRCVYMTVTGAEVNHQFVGPIICFTT